MKKIVILLTILIVNLSFDCRFESDAYIVIPTEVFLTALYCHLN